jgi:protein phosphatase
MPYINFQQLEALEQTMDFSRRFKWKSAARSEVGNVRQDNEDAYLNSLEYELWAVADGMGGLARGDYASGVSVEALVHFSRSQSIALSVRDLEMRLRRAHDLCRGSFPGERVGSTVATMFGYAQYVFFLWAGDSRIYRLRDGELSQVSEDHTVAQQKLARGELSAMQARLHPSAHVLTRAIGVHQTLHLDLDFAPIEPGDRYLICSDGLYNDLQLHELERLIGEGDAQTAIDALFKHALAGPGRDNMTAIVVDAAEDSA